MLPDCLPGLCCLVVFVGIADSCSIQSTKRYVSRGSSVDMPVNVKLSRLNQLVKYSVKLASESNYIISVNYDGLAFISGIISNRITFNGDFYTGNLSYTIQSKNDSFIGDHEVRRSDHAALLSCTTLYILGKHIAPSLVANTNRQLIGDTITFLCTSVSTTVPSNHSLNMAYSWTVDGVTNPTDSRYTYSTSRHTFALSDVTKGDSSKIFRCTATEVVTGWLTSDTSNTYSVNVLDAPDITTSLSNNDHSSVQLKCHAAGVPDIYNYTAVTQTWRGTTIPNPRPPVSNTPLQFTDLQLQDTGIYKCHVNNGVTDLYGKLDQTAIVEHIHL